MTTSESDKSRIDLARIPQGTGSRLDSDTIDGFQAVGYSKPGPNVLVATGPGGTLPESVIPLSGASLIAMLFGSVRG